MSANEIAYALKYHKNSLVKIMASTELVAKYPEALISFLESKVEFNWPEDDPLNNILLTNRPYISACTNQGSQGIKYLLSRDGTRFLRVMLSRLAVAHAPNLVVEFLESKLSLDDCNPLPNHKGFGEFFLF